MENIVRKINKQEEKKLMTKMSFLDILSENKQNLHKIRMSFKHILKDEKDGFTPETRLFLPATCLIYLF